MPRNNSSQKQPSSRSPYILKEISKEIVHLENMKRRVKSLSSKYTHRSYIERILLRIDYVTEAFKDLRMQVKGEEEIARILEEARHAGQGEDSKG